MNRNIPLDDPSTIPDSYWAATASPLEPIDVFKGHTCADVVVIGAGFTGLSAALHIAESGLKVVVLDAREPGWGASGRNNGQVVAALKHEPAEIEKRFGSLRAETLMDVVGNGPNLVFSLIERHKIECAATRNGVITAAHSIQSLKGLESRTRIWNEKGVPLKMMSREELASASGTNYYFGATLDPRGGSLNPLAYARGLARAALQAGAMIFRSAMVQSVEREGDQWRVILASGSVQAPRVIVGTNAYTGDFVSKIKKTILPSRTPQLVSRPLDAEARARILPFGQSMSDTRLLTLGIRMHPDGRLQMGGGGGTGGAERDEPYKNLERKALELFPFLNGIEWEYRWTGFMAMTPDRYPLLFDIAPGIAGSMGYSGRGIAMATIMGRELSRWALGEASIDNLALPSSRPQPLFYHSIANLAVEAGIIYYGFKDKVAARKRNAGVASHN